MIEKLSQKRDAGGVCGTVAVVLTKIRIHDQIDWTRAQRIPGVHWAVRSSEGKKRVFQCRRGFGKRREILKDSAEFVRLCSKRSL